MATQEPPSPPDPSYDEIAAALIALYAIADTRLLAEITRQLKATPPTPLGLQALLPRLRRIVREVVQHLGAQTPPLVRAMVEAASSQGHRDGSDTVSTAVARIPTGGSGGGSSTPPGTRLAGFGDEPFNLGMSHGEHAAQAIRDDLQSSLDDVRKRLTRLPDDIYKAIAPHGAIYQVLDNPVNPAQAQAMAWRVFASQGITGFTDRAGRNWSLSAYVEMAVRTSATRAYNTSHLNRMYALGIRYFTVPGDGHPCPLCLPWEGKVLIDEARPPAFGDPRVEIAATIAEARAAGLWHPNCRHTLIPVFPGITELPEPKEWTEEHAIAYRNTQRQRAIELEIRKAKRAAQYALDPAVRADAQRDVRRLQARMRQHIADTGLLRHSRREQIDLRDDRMKLPDLPRRSVA